MNKSSLILAALLLGLVWAGLDAVAAPELATGQPCAENERTVNAVSLAIAGGQVSLAWTADPQAFSYRVYSSATPAGGFSPDFTGVYSGTGWTAPANPDRRFFYVVSVAPGNPGELVTVQGGTFNLEYDTAIITISTFRMGKYEVTQGEFQDVMGFNPSEVCGVGDRYPVYNVTWYRAVEYCNRLSFAEGLTPCYSYLNYGTNPSNWPPDWNSDYWGQGNIACQWSANGYRLPTEMEFMYAAKGGNQTPASGYNLWSGTNNGTLLGYYAWFMPTAYDPSYGTKPVGTKLPNQLGLYDLSGNLWEWCWDVLGDYPTGYVTNPTGVASGDYRTYRGGFWSSYDWECRVSEHYYTVANNYGGGIGFRVVRRP